MRNIWRTLNDITDEDKPWPGTIEVYKKGWPQSRIGSWGRIGQQANLTGAIWRWATTQEPTAESVAEMIDAAEKASQSPFDAIPEDKGPDQ